MPLGQTVLLVCCGFSGKSCACPFFAVLLVLEPFVSLILTAFGFLGIVALILKFSGDLPHFPFRLMTAFSVDAILLLMAYHTVIGFFSRSCLRRAPLVTIRHGLPTYV